MSSLILSMGLFEGGITSNIGGALNTDDGGRKSLLAVLFTSMATRPCGAGAGGTRSGLQKKGVNRMTQDHNALTIRTWARRNSCQDANVPC